MNFIKLIYEEMITTLINKQKLINYKKNKLLNKNNIIEKQNKIIIYYERFEFNNLKKYKKEEIQLIDRIKKQNKYILKYIHLIDIILLKNMNFDTNYIFTPKFYTKIDKKNYGCFKKYHFVYIDNHINLRGLRNKFIKEIIDILYYLHKNKMDHYNLDISDFIYDKKENKFKLWRFFKKDIKKLHKSPESYFKNYNKIIDVRKYENIWSLGLIIFKLFCYNIDLYNIHDYLTHIYLDKYSINYINNKFINDDLKYKIKTYMFSNNNKLYKNENNCKIIDILFKKILIYDYKKRITIKELKNSIFYKSL